MADPETTDAFVMRGARAAAENGIPHISQQIAALERAVADNPSFAFDLAKYIVESTCKTILSERKLAFDKNDDLPRLFKLASKNVSMLPVAAVGDPEAENRLARTLNGLHTALQGVCELRNAHGFTAHGSNKRTTEMESVQATLAAQAADAIVGFLFSAHRVERDGTQPKATGHSRTIDKLLDTVFPTVDIAGQPYDVSEVLYATDREAYLAVAASVDESRNVLAEFDTQYPSSLNPTLREIRFLHYDGVAYMKTVDDKGTVKLEDTAFVSGDGQGDLFFPLNNSADENAELLVRRLDGYSIINCFELFTSEAAQRIADGFEANRPQPPSLPEGSAGASQ